jgi:hypothetical protein
MEAYRAMTINRVCTLLQSLATEQPILPPTELYCEGWLLRIILDWYASHEANGDPLAFAGHARWFSEAQLPSAFRPRKRGDPLGESRSHADGVIGHFTIDRETRAGILLDPQATCFIVLEAKIFSGLAAGIKHVKDYNQAARSIACMAETLSRADRHASAVNRLAFYVLAPRQQIAKGIFTRAINPELVDTGVQARVRDYGGAKDAWYAEWFLPTRQQTQIEALAWEDVIASIAARDPVAGDEIGAFYAQCLRFNT